ELTTILESNKYRLGGSADTVSTDGGSTSYLYEQGTNLTLHPITDAGLVGYWTFDEGTGTQALDSSGNNNTGTWQGTLGSQWTTGKIGGAGNFNGINNDVVIGNNGVLNFNATNLTISSWFYISNYQEHQRIVMADGYLYGFKVTTNQIVGAVNNVWTGSATIPVNNGYWVFGTVVFRRDLNTVSFYVNGLYSGDYNITFSTMNPSSIHIGGYGYLLNGLIDDVRIYNRALSPAEILSIYNATK
ncbi:MAG: LamG domain-containing protein, partial [Candidatus Paceibacterota bacterium]